MIKKRIKNFLKNRIVRWLMFPSLMFISAILGGTIAPIFNLVTLILGGLFIIFIVISLIIFGINLLKNLKND